MAKLSNNEEFKFLEEYFRFYSKKNGVNIGGFVAFAEKTLVKTGQIAPETLSTFEATYHLQIELAKKEKQVEILKKEIDELKQKVLNNSRTVVNDGCGGGSAFSRNVGC